MGHTLKINKLLSSHKGTQPTRVLQELIPSKLENTYPGFLALVDKVINDFNLHPGINYHLNEFPIIQNVDGHPQTPFVDKEKRIHIHETFLSYVWCVSYTLTNFYNDAVSKNVDTEHEISDERIENILALFDYGVSLIKFFTPWDKETLPNPEVYDKTDELSTEIANRVFIYSLNYILCHEFAHVELNHAEKRRLTGYNKDTILQTEKEADQRALELMQMGMTNNTKEIISISIIVGLYCLLYFTNKTTSVIGTHPDIDNRIHNVLEQINPEPSSPIWGIAYFGYRLWDYKFEKWYSWTNGVHSNKELYYHFYEQIQEEKQKSPNKSGR